LALCTSYITLQAQQRVRTTTRATSYDISDNLDLDAVSSIFADSKNLEEFENRLNDPDNRISNLDLNQDGYVDYLRVVETTNDRNSLVVVQAVLDRDIYQDVATIEIERVPDGRHRIQVVGDPWIYGPEYVIEPIFVRTPLIFSFFWGPRYVVWHSPYYWGYYPRWYYNYKPYPTHRYCRHVDIYVDRRVTFNRINERHFQINDKSFNVIRRRDFAERNPEKSFENRHRESSNAGRQIQRQSSRSYENKSNRRIENENSSRRNENVRREQERRPANQEMQRESPPRREYSRPANQERQREVQPRREYSQPARSQQRNQSYQEQRTTQSRPESREKSRQQIENSSRERSSNTIERKSRNDVKQSTQSTRKAEPAKKEEKSENSKGRR
jgi:hypothetical protein